MITIEGVSLLQVMFAGEASRRTPVASDGISCEIDHAFDALGLNLTVLLFVCDRKSFDVSRCNDQLDQDLEGALRAIEGEEEVGPHQHLIGGGNLPTPHWGREITNTSWGRKFRKNLIRRGALHQHLMGGTSSTPHGGHFTNTSWEALHKHLMGRGALRQHLMGGTSPRLHGGTSPTLHWGTSTTLHGGTSPTPHGGHFTNTSWGHFTNTSWGAIHQHLMGGNSPTPH